jgi:hypothetical protein
LNVVKNARNKWCILLSWYMYTRILILKIKLCQSEFFFGNYLEMKDFAINLEGQVFREELKKYFSLCFLRVGQRIMAFETISISFRLLYCVPTSFTTGEPKVPLFLEGTSFRDVGECWKNI